MGQTGLADLNHDDLNKKIIRFKSQLPVYFEYPLCQNI